MVGNTVNDRRPEASGAVPLIESAEGAHLIPPRFWWLKRLLLAGGLLVVALIGLRLWWGWKADRLLQEQIAGYRARGEMVLPEEIDAALAKIPDEGNAALLYEKASAELITMTPSGVNLRDFFDATDEVAFLKKNLAAAAQLLQANSKSLEMIRAACSRDRAVWPCKLAGRFSALGACLPDYSAQRYLSRFLSLVVGVFAEKGDHRSAIRVLHDHLVHADSMSDDPVLLGAFVSIGNRHLVARRVEAISSTLLVSTGNRSVQEGVLPAGRGEVSDLITTLIHADSWFAKLDAMTIGERAVSMEMMRMFTESPGVLGANFFETALWWVTAQPVFPLWTLEQKNASNRVSELRQWITRPNWPRWQNEVQRRKSRNSLLYLLSHPMTEGKSGLTYDGFVRQLATLTALERMAGTALAIRLYQIDHGHRPDDLARLVPDYLDSVPRDPFAKDGGPIRFGSGAHGDVLYSVHMNGVDDDGIEFLYERDHRNKALDLVFYLDGRPEFRSETVP